jgi:hypothetical protein
MVKSNLVFAMLLIANPNNIRIFQRELINVHEQHLPDPYVRLHLLPDFKKDKKKTNSIHDTLHPVYDSL